MSCFVNTEKITMGRLFLLSGKPLMELCNESGLFLLNLMKAVVFPAHGHASFAMNAMQWVVDQ